MLDSSPTLSTFNPHIIKSQYSFIKEVRTEFDYEQGYYELLLSGSVGSSKTTLAAHVGLTHCLFNPGARLLLGRKALPDLKRTIFQKCLDHIGNDLQDGKDFFVNTTQASIKFSNGSEIISTSWSDKKYKKVRSLDISAAIIEELSENEGDDVEVYDEIKMRVGRLTHIKEKWIIGCTNPDSPASYWYKYFMLNGNDLRRVYYSLTSDNPFLPKSYIQKLIEDLDPKMVERMIYGRWIDIAGETIYYQYDSSIHYKSEEYKINTQYPVGFSFDFNIGDGKPLSVVFFQYIDDTFHFFDEIVIEGLRTEQACVEANNRGLFKLGVPYYKLHGDSTGSQRSTNSNTNNFQIIRDFLHLNQIPFKYEVITNPPIKTRHNMMNGYLKNSEGRVRFFIYGKSKNKCKILDEGMRLTKLKKGSSYIEDDSKHYQHITTAAGYAVYSNVVTKNLDPVITQL